MGKNPIFLSTAIAAAMVLSAAATAGYLGWKHPAFAEVVSAEPVMQAVLKPDKACRDELARRRAAPGDEPLLQAGTAIDGMAGGVVSDGARAAAPGPQAFTVAGRHCLGGNRLSEKVTAWDVHYRLHGRTEKVRMDHDPGVRLPVRDGRVVLTPARKPRRPGSRL